MSEGDDITTERPDAYLAGEYALGLLSAAEAVAFETRLAGDPALRADLALYREHFADLAASVADVAPPARVKAALDARLAPPARRRSWREWLLGAGVAVALAIAVISFVPMGETYSARLVSEGALVVAQAETRGQTLTIDLTGSAAAGRDFELWWIVDGVPPLSLGVVRTGGQTVILPENLVSGTGITLAISDEPTGGSPTGAPTGAVLASAALAAG